MESCCHYLMGCIKDTRMATVNLSASSPAPGAGRLDMLVSPLTASAQAHKAVAEPGRPPRKPAQRERGSRSSRGGDHCSIHTHTPPPRVPLFRPSANDRGPRARWLPQAGCVDVSLPPPSVLEDNEYVIAAVLQPGHRQASLPARPTICCSHAV